MLTLSNQIAISRLLRAAVDGRRLLQGFPSIAQHRLPYALTLRRPASVGPWKVYEDFVGSEKLGRLQNNIFVVNELDLLNNSHVRLSFAEKIPKVFVYYHTLYMLCHKHITPAVLLAELSIFLTLVLPAGS